MLIFLAVLLALVLLVHCWRATLIVLGVIAVLVLCVSVLGVGPEKLGATTVKHDSSAPLICDGVYPNIRCR